jgi:hypothetical protein
MEITVAREEELKSKIHSYYSIEILNGSWYMAY